MGCWTYISSSHGGCLIKHRGGSVVPGSRCASLQAICWMPQRDLKTAVLRWKDASRALFLCVCMCGTVYVLVLYITHMNICASAPAIHLNGISVHPSMRSSTCIDFELSCALSGFDINIVLFGVDTNKPSSLLTRPLPGCRQKIDGETEKRGESERKRKRREGGNEELT